MYGPLVSVVQRCDVSAVRDEELYDAREVASGCHMPATATEISGNAQWSTGSVTSLDVQRTIAVFVGFVDLAARGDEGTCCVDAARYARPVQPRVALLQE